MHVHFDIATAQWQFSKCNTHSENKKRKTTTENRSEFTATSISYCQQWHVVVQAGNKQLQFGRPKHVLRGYLRLLCFFKKRGVVEETGTGGGGALTDTFIGLGRWFRQRSIKGRHRKARYLWGAVVSWPENSSAFHLHFVLREVSELNVAVRDHAAQTHTVGRRGGGCDENGKTGRRRVTARYRLYNCIYKLHAINKRYEES